MAQQQADAGRRHHRDRQGQLAEPGLRQQPPQFPADGAAAAERAGNSSPVENRQRQRGQHQRRRHQAKLERQGSQGPVEHQAQ